jgi:hypothetical protein
MVPYVSNIAYKKIIKKKPKGMNIFFPDYNIMPTWKELKHEYDIKTHHLPIDQNHMLFYFSHKLPDEASVPTDLIKQFIFCDTGVRDCYIPFYKKIRWSV